MNPATELPLRRLAGRWALGAASGLALAGVLRIQGRADLPVLDQVGFIIRPLAGLGRSLFLWVTGHASWLAAAALASTLALAGTLARRGPGGGLRPALLALGTGLAAQLSLMGRLPAVAAGCWCAAGVFALAMRGTRPGPLNEPERPELPAWLAAAVIAFIGTAVTLYHLNVYPLEPFVWSTENAGGLMDIREQGFGALAARRTWGLSLISTSSESLVWAAAAWAMTRFAGWTVSALRGLSALAGLLDLYLVYRLARLDGQRRRVALLAAALLGANAYHLYFSRADYYCGFTATAVLGAFVLARAAVRTGRARTFLALGVVLGLLPHLYSVSRPASLALLACLAWPVLRGPDRLAALRGFVIAAAAATALVAVIVTDLPAAYNAFLKTRGERIFDMVNDGYFMSVHLGRPPPPPPYPLGLKLEAARNILVGNTRVLLDGLTGVRPIPAQNAPMDMEGFFLSPLLTAPVVVGVAIGLCGWRRRQERGSMLYLLGIGLGLGPALLTNEVDVWRLVNALPFLVYAAALALGRLWEELEQPGGHWSRAWAAALVLAAATTLCLTDIGRFYLPPETPTLRNRQGYSAEAVREAVRSGSRRVYFYADDPLRHLEGWIRLANEDRLVDQLGGELRFEYSAFELIEGVQDGRYATEAATAFFSPTPEVERLVAAPLAARIGPRNRFGPEGVLGVPAAWLQGLRVSWPRGRWVDAGRGPAFFADLAPVANRHAEDRNWCGHTRYWWGFPMGLLEFGARQFYVPRGAPSVVLQGCCEEYTGFPRQVTIPTPGLGRADAVEILGMVSGWGGEPEGEEPTAYLQVLYEDGGEQSEPLRMCDFWSHLHARRELDPGSERVLDEWGFHLDARRIALDGARPIAAVRFVDSDTGASPLLAALTFVRGQGKPR